MMLFLENLQMFVLCGVLVSFLFMWCDTVLSGFYSVRLCFIILYRLSILTNKRSN